MSRELTLRARAATYLNTSIVVMTELEFHNYLRDVIAFQYPHLKLWYDAEEQAQEAVTHGEQYRDALTEAATQVLDIIMPLPDMAAANVVDNIGKIKGRILQDCVTFVPLVHRLYEVLTFIRDIPDDLDPYEWWLCTPTGPESCSRDVGDIRTQLPSSKGDEWDSGLELQILQYQLDRFPHIAVPTGYACAETIRRLRITE